MAIKPILAAALPPWVLYPVVTMSEFLLGKIVCLAPIPGLGIPLGDRCTVEAGLYLTASSKVEVIDDKGEVSETVKASELASKSDLLFIRNSLTGSIQCRPNKKIIELNEELHSND